MNIAFQTSRSEEPSMLDMMNLALAPYLLVGMPHLTPYGLSETWLMKELGHRHWLMLARDLGMENADFRTRNGDQAYAAICATSLQNARLDLVEANDILAIHSSLRPISRAQFSSIHHLNVRGQPVADVELISTFVYRQVAGDNHSLARLDSFTVAQPHTRLSDLAQTATAIRRGTIETHLGLGWQPLEGAPSLIFKPGLTEEFNGAGLFYFAQFQALANRAFETWFPEQGMKMNRRDVFFSGNIGQRDIIHATLSHRTAKPDGISCNLSRGDGQLIGRVFSLLEDTAAARTRDLRHATISR